MGDLESSNQRIIHQNNDLIQENKLLWGGAYAKQVRMKISFFPSLLTICFPLSVREKNDKKIENLMFFIFSMAKAAGENPSLQSGWHIRERLPELTFYQFRQ